MTIAHESFEWIRSETIDSLKLTVVEYRHRVTGAQHFHFDAPENPENVFLVALRTVPTDSTGVAHILEHTALCGSEKYPVRDPFFMMIRRSLNTFMNAFTSSDWTAYPFASQNRKDFANLLDVYLDAVFFANLDPLDFAQEGHRLEFAEPGNPDSPLMFKGVVYNEMKGAMSSPSSILWQSLTRYLFPTTTYHHNSGGDPECIVDLSYTDLVAFYRTHYHPTNAVFMTYGNIPASEHQQIFQERVLHRFEKLDEIITVPAEKRYHAPVRVEESYPLSDDAMEGKTHIVLGWLIGSGVDLETSLRAELLADVLLDNSGSPLLHALETSDLGSSPSPLCGLEDSHREMVFACGLEGSDPEHAAAVEQLIYDVLRDVAENGVAPELVEAVLHQIELGQREISGDSYPYGLQLILGTMGQAVHRGDVAGALNIDRVLVKLRQEAQSPDFIPSLVRQFLLDNPHMVRLTLKPDTGFGERRDAAETHRLNAIKTQLTAEQKTELIELAAQLSARQERKLDPETLPKVGLEDVPATLPVFHGETLAGTIPATRYSAGTNGLVYAQLIVDLPQLDDELLNLLPYYSVLLTELGIGARDYREAQVWQSRVCGGIHAHTNVRGAIDDVQSIKGHFIIGTKALARNCQPMTELMVEMFQHVRFDELDHIHEVISQLKASQMQSVTGSGHTLAMLAASSGMSPVAALSHRLRGLAGIRHTKIIEQKLENNDALAAFAAGLAEIHRRIQAAPRQILLIGEDEILQSATPQVCSLWENSGLQQAPYQPFALSAVRQTSRQGWLTNTQVNFCAKAYPTVPVDHPDAPVLSVLGGFLRNGYLHRAIREQGGAYGGGANQDSDVAAFRFYSYRDPRMEETLADFDQSVQWLLQEQHEWRHVEEAILGVIGNMDKPGSPAGEAKKAFHNQLLGRTPEQRQRYRERVLSVTLDDLQRVASTYLQPEAASMAVVSRVENGEKLRKLGLETTTLV
ncbi:insulinase family protein [Chrysiogenes arsenatis]|uniref:insulinase family protein n=1 Tax=Chrysiogenes arsenatis TaxID=309797 RepID=UPI000405EF46|nr:insulinase family protein [Chrysiogenes arsenatis]